MSKHTNTPIVGSKSILARLLASEGISVRHDPSAETASFDVANRSLVLPVWESMSDHLYDMLVGHEVGHALFTPFDAEKEKSVVIKGPWNADAQNIGGDSHGHVAMAYLNIIEDARIEKLIKAKFPGLRRDFVAGYKALMGSEFFGKKAPSTLIDRINLHFKFGVSAENEMNITFSPAEQVFVDRISNAMTYDEVVQIVKDIWDYESSKNNKNCPQNLPEYVPQVSQGSGEEGNNEDNTNSKGGSGISGGKGGEHTPPSMPETHDSYLKNLKKLNSDKIDNTVYVSMPQPKLENIIITPKEVEELFADEYSYRSNLRLHIDAERLLMVQKTNKFIQSSNKSVSILVKQFEMKKAADSHKRSSSAKTGVLDTLKMMKYRFDDDVFARHMTIQNGKNHGVVMFIDWSSSMSRIIEDTIKQCFLIALFCKKCNIPFDVYAFSSNNIRMNVKAARARKSNTRPPVDTEEPLSWIDEPLVDHYGIPDNSRVETGMGLSPFSLIHFLSSSMTMKEMTNSMTNMFMITAHRHGVPGCFWLNGTPLGECIVAATDIVNLFRTKHNLQIVNSIFLTDGEGGVNALNSYNKSRKIYCVNKKKKITYDLDKICEIVGENAEYRTKDTEALLRIHAMETGSNVLGFYLYDAANISNTAMLRFIDLNGDENTSRAMRYSYGRGNLDTSKMDEKIQKKIITRTQQYKKEGYFVADQCCTMGGYKELYVIRASSLEIDDSETTDLEKLENGSSAMKIRTAIRNQMKDSAVSKNLLNRIIDNICA